MLRLKLVFGIIFLVILSLGIMQTIPVTEAFEPLGRAMEATGAKVEQCSINAWAMLPSDQLADEELERIVRQVMTELEVTSDQYQLTRRKTNKQDIVQAESWNENAHILTSAKVVSGGGKSEVEGYLVINIDQKVTESSSIRQIQKKITAIIKKNANLPRISTCLIGYLDGKLMDGEWHRLLQSAFMTIDAIIIDKLDAKDFVSYTGFTSTIAQWLQMEDKRINFNMAMHYNKYENRTYVIIGSPIITREY